MEENNFDIVDNNINGEIAHFRDTFLEAEKEFIDSLKKVPVFRELVEKYNASTDVTTLFEVAQELAFKVENNLIPMEDMQGVETKMAIILMAIQDKVRRKVLVRTPDYEEEIEYRRGR